MTPQFLNVRRKVRETADVVTLDIPVAGETSVGAGFIPGQFNMLYAFGVGEVPISICGDPAISDRIVHTIRAVGPVSDALTKLKRGASVGVRGPFGSGWPIEAAVGSDVLVIAGGIGLAPLRPALYRLLHDRERYGRLALLYGARNPGELLYRRELDKWRRAPELQMRVTVDSAAQDWTGDVGVVTKLLSKVRFDPAETVAMICGPEVMIRFTAAALEDLGMEQDRIYVSLERNMKCAVGWCGHCQFGGDFICKDGPIFRFDRISTRFGMREI